MTSTALSVEQEIGHLVLRFLEASRHHIATALDELGLTMAEGLALHHLAEPVPMRQLAADMGYDASHITGIVDRLEARGLVERRPDDRDRRVKLIVVTDEGWRVGRQVEHRAFTSNPILERLTPSQRVELRALLRLVVEPDRHGPEAATDSAEPADP